jgi:hypothetical protein
MVEVILILYFKEALDKEGYTLSLLIDNSARIAQNQ